MIVTIIIILIIIIIMIIIIATIIIIIIIYIIIIIVTTIQIIIITTTTTTITTTTTSTSTITNYFYSYCYYWKNGVQHVLVSTTMITHLWETPELRTHALKCAMKVLAWPAFKGGAGGYALLVLSRNVSFAVWQHNKISIHEGCDSCMTDAVTDTWLWLIT